MITVWGRNNSINVQKVVWALEETSTPYERKDVGGAYGGLDSDEYGALNPNRRIPTLVDNDTVLWESNAIVRYVTAKYGGPLLYPEQPERRAVADMWMDWVQTEALPHLLPVFRQLIRTPEADRDPKVIETGVEKMKEVFGRLDAWLADRPYVGGDVFTMGDVPAGACVWRYLALDIDRPDLPNLNGWYERLRERPAYTAHVCLPLS